MKLSTIPNTAIFKADKDQTVTVLLWNNDDPTPCCSFKTDSKIYWDNVTFEGTPNDFPDCEHIVELKAGESIYAWCSVENAVEYKVVTE